ncbi:MAG: hypothetical protein HY039_04340 [Nitrospirae bacterium]|nr:hypothetical protein [Nitrospirota bacterium]
MRVIALMEAGAIRGFVVQYEAYIKDAWRPVVRFDTMHGFAHKDVLHPDGAQDKQPMRFGDYNLAFTFAIQDLKASWRWYRLGYEAEVR